MSVVPLVDRGDAADSAQDASIRSASQQFCNMAADQGWTDESRGLFGLAQILAKGRSNETDQTPGYLDRLRENTGGETIDQRLVADMEAATSGLNALTVQLETQLTNDGQGKSPERADVVGYERALVHAHQTRQTFDQAIEVIAGSTPEAKPTLETALTALDAEIERARSAADTLAARYAGRDSSVSQSVS